jgi:Golgi phosphoprotein 3 (GPP34)
MLLAENLLLLVTDDASGRLAVPGDQLDKGLGGANLVELTLMGRVDLSGTQGEDGAGKPGRLVVRDSSPAGDEVLDAALRIVLAHAGRKPSAVIRPLGKDLRRTLYERLAASGAVRAERGRALGVFPVRRWPAQDAGHEAEVRQLVTQALVQHAAPDPGTAALIALVHALRCEHKIVDPRLSGLSRRQLRTRAEEITEGGWAPESVRTMIDAIAAAVKAAAAASSAAG